MSCARFASAIAPGTSRTLLNWLQPMLATMTSPAQITARRKNLAKLNQSSSGADERHPASILASSGNGIEMGVPRRDCRAAFSRRLKIFSSRFIFQSYIR